MAGLQFNKTGFDQQCFFCMKWSSWIQACKTEGRPISDTSHNSECSLNKLSELVYRAIILGGGIVKCNRQRLPSCDPGTNPKHKTYAQYSSNYKFVIELECEKNENKQKEAAISPFFSKVYRDPSGSGERNFCRWSKYMSKTSFHWVKFSGSFMMPARA